MDNTLCGRFFGMVFYSFDDPAASRKKLYDSLTSLIDLGTVTFTRKSIDGEFYGASGRYMAQIEKVIATAEFARSEFMRLHDGADDSTQTATIEYWLRTIHPEFKSKTPNYVYAELPLHLDRDIVWHTFRGIFERNYFCYAIGNEVITGHHEKHSRSGATAARELKMAQDYSVGFWEVFGNQSLLQQLSPQKLFYGPPEFAAVSAQFAVSAIKAAAKCVGACSTENAHYFRVTPALSRSDLWLHLQPLHVKIQRPLKYWKDDCWSKWFQQVSFGSTK